MPGCRSKCRRACVVASTWSSWATEGNCVNSVMYSFTQGQTEGEGIYTLPASNRAVTAWARATLEPSGSTGIMPLIWCLRLSMTAGPLALSPPACA